MVYQIIRKLLSMFPLLLIVSIMIFILINMLPGNAADVMLAEGASIEGRQLYLEEFGLNDPLHVQYMIWLGRVVRGNFGRSFITGQMVSLRIVERLGCSIQLIITAMIFSVLIAIPLAVLCAVKRNSIFDYIASAIAVTGVAMPGFWLALLLIYGLSVNLGVLPASGWVPFAVNPGKNIVNMIMPVISVSVGICATLVRQTRSAMLEVLNQDYIITAKAKGLSGMIVLWKHALRNALIPVVTVISMQIGRIIGGATIVETVYSLPGMGKLLVDAINQRDYPVIMAQVLMMAAAIVFINTLVDILYIIIDPRISTTGKAK